MNPEVMLVFLQFPFELCVERQRALRQEAERSRPPRERQWLFELDQRMRRTGEALARYLGPRQPAYAQMKS